MRQWAKGLSKEKHTGIFWDKEIETKKKKTTDKPDDTTWREESKNIRERRET